MVCVLVVSCEFERSPKAIKIDQIDLCRSLTEEIWSLFCDFFGLQKLKKTAAISVSHPYQPKETPNYLIKASAINKTQQSGQKPNNGNREKLVVVARLSEYPEWLRLLQSGFALILSIEANWRFNKAETLPTNSLQKGK